MRIHRSPTNLLGPVLTTSLIITACGGNDGTGDQAAATVVTVPSENSLAVDVDLGGQSPTDPDLVDKLDDVNDFRSDRGMPNEQAELLAYHAADRGIHLRIGSAVVYEVNSTWTSNPDGGGVVSSSISYVLDATGLDEATVVTDVENALDAAGLGDPERSVTDEFDNPSTTLTYEGFEVEIVGVPEADERFLPEGFLIQTSSRTPDTAPPLITAVGQVAGFADEFAPDGRIESIETGSGLEGVGVPMRRMGINRQAADDPGAFDDVVADVEARAGDVVGEDLVIESENEDSVWFSGEGFSDHSVWVRRNDERVAVEFGYVEFDL